MHCFTAHWFSIVKIGAWDERHNHKVECLRLVVCSSFCLTWGTVPFCALYVCSLGVFSLCSLCVLCVCSLCVCVLSVCPLCVLSVFSLCVLCVFSLCSLSVFSLCSLPVDCVLCVFFLCILSLCSLCQCVLCVCSLCAFFLCVLSMLSLRVFSPCSLCVLSLCSLSWLCAFCFPYAYALGLSKQMNGRHGKVSPWQNSENAVEKNGSSLAQLPLLPIRRTNVYYQTATGEKSQRRS